MAEQMAVSMVLKRVDWSVVSRALKSVDWRVL